MEMAMRSVFATLLAAMCSLAAAQDKQLTYTTSAIPLGTALNALSKQAGTTLRVSDELASEPVVLRLKNVPLQVFEDKIAQEFVGEWVPYKGGVQLARTDKAVNAFQSKFAADKLAAIQDSMKSLAAIQQSKPMDSSEANRIAAAYVKMLKDVQSNSFTGDGSGMRVAFSNRTGDLRLLATLVDAVGAETLASLPVGDHMFSLNPTPMELPINNVDTSVVTQFIQQHNMLAKVVNAIKPSNVYDGDGDYAIHNSALTLSDNARVLLDVQVNAAESACWVWLQVYDKQQEIAVSYQLGKTFHPADYEALRAKSIAAAKGDIAVQLPPVDVELVKHYDMSDDKKQPFSADALNVIGHPDTNDPFSIAFSKILIAQAEHENRNLIASAADDSWNVPAVDEKGAAKPVLYEARLSVFGSIQYNRSDGWLIVSPVNPLLASEERINRDALGEFTRAYIANGFVAIEDWAKLATYVAPSDDAGLALAYWNLLRGQRGMSYVNDWDALRLYGLLSPDQVNTLSSGNSLAYQTLTQDEQACLQRIVYQSGSIRDAKKTNGDKDHPQAVEVQGIDTQPTESVPKGIPSDAQLTARSDSKDTLFVKGWMGNGTEQEMNMGEVGWMLVDQDIRSNNSSQNDDDKITSVRLGKKRYLTFDLTLNDRVKMEVTLQEDHYATDEIPVDQLKDKLPPDTWAKLSAIMDQARQSRKNNPNMLNTPPPTQAPPR